MPRSKPKPSASSTSRSPGRATRFGSPLETAKVAVEQRLTRSRLRAVIVRPDEFHEIHLSPIGRFDPVAGKAAVIGRGDTGRRWVSTEDVAALVASVTVEPEPAPVVEFGGPEVLSRNEAIELAEQLSGRPIRIQRMPRWAARAGVRMLSRPNDALASVFAAGLLQDLVPATWSDGPLRQRGITPRSTTAFLREQVLAGEAHVEK